jgi:HPt (histidine-containing phosphotransfer) domain-containing protein
MLTQLPYTPEPWIYSSLATEPGFADLVATYVNDMPSRLQQLEAQFQAGNWDELRRLAHQMKGAAGSYGFDTITQQAARLEAAAARRDSIADIELNLSELKQLCARMRTGAGERQSR